MDIIHLLEVLNPLQNVITVKIDNDKGGFATFSDFIIAVAPTVIAGFAIWFSYRQFKISQSKQIEQFNHGIKQQINELKINTQLATEVELMKDESKALREAFVSFVDVASSIYSSKSDFKQYAERLGEDALKHQQLSCQAIIANSSKFLQARLLLISYLNLDDPEEKNFYDCIIAIGDCAFNGDGTGEDLGILQGKGASLCFKLIKKKRDAILSLVDNITD
ncbi:TPA: hypothetical protein ACGQTC_003107 [Citrobacter braakii]|nr:MAG TPA: hypothetical protein [Caudoviricetes sp.]